MSPIRRTTMLNSFVIVLKGLALGFFTPAKSGDIFIRMYALGDEKSKVFYAVMVNRFTQFLTTALFGVIGFYYLSIGFFDLNWLYALFIAVLIIMLVSFVVRKYYYRKVADILQLYSLSFLVRVLGVSMLRYLVFAVQFYLVLRLFEIDAHSEVLFFAVTAIFLLKSMVPVFNFFGELGIRETAAVYVLHNIMFFSKEAVVSASLHIWFFNVVVPVAVGGILFLVTRTKYA